MSRPTRPAPPGPLDAERLAGMASILEAAVPLESGDPAQLVAVRTGPTDDLAAGTFEVGLRPLDGHPFDELAGFVAPGDWSAIGLVATGRARSLDDGIEPFAVRTVHLVARTGAWASRCTPADGAPGGADVGGTATGGGDPVPDGRLDDALRRAVGVPTAPPPASTIELWALQWLDDLLASAASSQSRRRRLRSLASIVGAHAVIAAFDLDPAAVDLTRLVAEADRLARLRGWPQLRVACAGGLWTHGEVDAELAGWLDDGSFARWVLAGLPELTDLHQALGVLLAPSAMSVIDDALAAWGLTPH